MINAAIGLKTEWRQLHIFLVLIFNPIRKTNKDKKFFKLFLLFFPSNFSDLSITKGKLDLRLTIKNIGKKIMRKYENYNKQYRKTIWKLLKKYSADNYK